MGAPIAAEPVPRAGPVRLVADAATGGWCRRCLPAAVTLPTIALGLFSAAVWRYDGLYGQDPFAYFDYAVGPLRGLILHGTPLPAMFWPLGYPALVAAASFLIGPSIAAGQSVSLLAAAGCVALTFLLGRDLLLWAGFEAGDARFSALAGALLLGVTGWMIDAGTTIMADSLAVMASLLSAWALVRWCRLESGGSRWLFLAGVALGWSAISRWGQLALAPVFLLALLPAVRAHPNRLRALLWLAVPAAAVIGVQLWLVLTVPPNPELGRWPFLGDLALAGGGGWAPLHLIQRDFLNADGVQRYGLPNVLYYATAAFRPKYLTPLFFPAFAIGVRRAFGLGWRGVPLLLCWPAAVLLLDAGLPEQNIRFVLPAPPPLALLAGLGVSGVRRRFGPDRQVMMLIVLTVGLLVVAAAGLYDMRKLAVAAASDRQTAAWVASRVPPRATVVSFEITATLSHDTRLRPRDLSTLSIGDLRHLDRSGPSFLVVRIPSMEGQWAPRSPGRNYRFLLPSLSPLGERNGYTLFRARSP